MSAVDRVQGKQITSAMNPGLGERDGLHTVILFLIKTQPGGNETVLPTALPFLGREERSGDTKRAANQVTPSSETISTDLRKLGLADDHVFETREERGDGLLPYARRLKPLHGAGVNEISK